MSLLFSTSAWACAVCFGDPNSSMSKALIWAVIFMLGVVGSVLAGILSVILVWMRRAQRLDLDPALEFRYTKTH